ncbi:MAG: DNRLRE domain-containing protein [Gammaproteobacteria bacterium]|nr:DNRLRE domain-containing protein [Gammaproteobacteria bacterium]
MSSGTKTFIRVDGPDEHKVGFVQFDVSALNGTLSTALLKLHVQDVLDPGVLDIHAAQGVWNELSLTHRNKPPYDPAPLASVALTGADEGNVISVDVTSLVQQWAASPSAAFGIALSSHALHALFDTRETAHEAFIEVQTN